MKTLERELSRAKVSANRVAVVVANEWKDGNDKVMPVKQWLEERRIVQVSNEGFMCSSFTLVLCSSGWIFKCDLLYFLLFYRTKLWRFLLISGGLSFYREKCSSSGINLL
jgi:hypothetical protein